MSIPYFTAEEIFNKNKHLGNLNSHRLAIEQSKLKDIHNYITPNYIQDYAGYSKCWQLCWARSGYSDASIESCKRDCGGAR